jgi:hypothetical protein
MGIIRKNRWYRSVVECSKRWVQSPVLKGKKKKRLLSGNVAQPNSNPVSRKRKKQKEKLIHKMFCF